MMTLEQIAEKLQDRRLDVVSAHTGVHANTLRDIRKGKRDNPTYQVVKALSDYLEGKQ